VDDDGEHANFDRGAAEAAGFDDAEI